MVMAPYHATVETTAPDSIGGDEKTFLNKGAFNFKLLKLSVF